MGTGLRYPHHSTRCSSQRVNLGQTLRDRQPAIITTTQMHKRERPRAGKCWDGGGEGLIEGRECFPVVSLWQCDRIECFSHGCLVLCPFDTFTLCHHP